MSEAAAEDQVHSDIPQEGESEGKMVRSFRGKAKNKAPAIQRFKIGRAAWLKTDSDGSYRMTVTEAALDPVANTWSYKLKDSMGVDYEDWVAETNLAAANPAKVV